MLNKESTRKKETNAENQSAMNKTKYNENYTKTSQFHIVNWIK